MYIYCTGHPIQFSKSDRILLFSRAAKVILSSGMPIVNYFLENFYKFLVVASRTPPEAADGVPARRLEYHDKAHPMASGKPGRTMEGRLREESGSAFRITQKGIRRWMPWRCDNSGDGLSSREVLSPAERLTSVFGMGTGVSAGRSSPPGS
jgi:hypothetical protein